MYDWGLCNKKCSTDFDKKQLRTYFNKSKIEMINGSYRSVIGFHKYY